jgi:hypothetical protein
MAWPACFAQHFADNVSNFSPPIYIMIQKIVELLTFAVYLIFFVLGNYIDAS